MMKSYKTKCPELKATLKRDVVLKAKLTSSKDAADFFRNIFDESIDIYETFFVVYLNNSNNTVGWYRVSQGGITGTVVDIRLVLKKALEVLCTSFICCHNHPSGNLFPSNEDIRLTNKLKMAAEIMDIKLIDHIILTNDSYYSFADEGKL
jgi:DNA repair protein RadC